MDSESSDTNLVIVTRARAKQYFRLYWKTIVLISTPLLLLPIHFISDSNMANSLYVFSVTMVYFVADVLHPGITSLVPITFHTLLGSNINLNMMLPVGSELFDCLSVMIMTIALENCKLNRRIAIRLLLIFGCSHYRLSLMLFFCTMFLSMWLTDIMACGLMMPVLKAILTELEKMGIMEMYHAVAKRNRDDYQEKYPKPTDFTIFYFLGIAYSASIGSMGTVIGSQSNQIFKMYCESLFPLSPKIEFPHIILLNLPGVLLMEALLYIWMNSYFLGMFRARSDVALEIGLSEEEAQYIRTLLSMQYQQLGRITFHEYVVGVIVIFANILQIAFGFSYVNNDSLNQSHLKTSAPSMLSVLLLFVAPINLDFIKFFKHNGRETLPTTPSRSCLTWKLVRDNLNWSVLFVIVGSSSAFCPLSASRVARIALPAREWPAPVLALLLGALCRLLGETASDATVTYCLLPSVARLSVASSVNPHYLMLAATLASSLPFHLITGSPVNSMVAAYVHIPPWKMMSAGVGPSVIAMVVVWFTVAVWSRAIWTDIYLYPRWAEHFVNTTV